MRNPHSFSGRTLALGCLLASSSLFPASALDVNGYDPTVEDRFLSGFGSPSDPPVLNTSPSFLGAGLDLSGIGWAANSGYSSGPVYSRTQNLALLSPIDIFNANHYPPGAADGSVGYSYSGNINFVNSSGTLVSDSVSPSGQQILYTPNYGYPDLMVTRMNSALTEADHITPLRLLDISSGNYNSKNVLVMGSEPGTGPYLATGQIAYQYGANIGLASSGAKPFNSFESGDSGSPVLITYKGQATLVGGIYLGNGYSDSILPTSNAAYGVAAYNPIPAINEVLAADGYATRWTIYDEPTDTANTANQWTGASGTGAFNSASNWSAGTVPAPIAGQNYSFSSIPTSVPIVFDASQANGRTSVNLGGDQNVRGILFRTNAGPIGFTFASGSKLTIGADGMRNEDTKTQTFNNAMRLSDSQNWEAVNGNVVVNGAVDNGGYLLVVQGAKDTTLNGTISGTGGLAKDETGTLTLGAVNTFTGPTFIHNGTLRLGVTNALSSSNWVQFDAANPAATLDLDGFNQHVAGLSSIRDGTGTVTNSGSGSGTNILTVGSNISNGFYSGVIKDGATAKVGLTKVGTMIQTLSGKNTYSGPTTIMSGGLFLKGAGSIDKSALITVGGGAKLDVSGVTGGYSLKSGQTLAGSGLIKGDVTMNSGSALTVGTLGSAATLTENGKLTLRGSTVFNFDLGASSDHLNLGSNVFDKGADFTGLTFNLNSTSSSGSFDLIDFASTTFTSADLSLFDSTGVDGTFALTGTELTFTIRDDRSTTNELEIAAAPEPTTNALILIALGTLGVLRHRRINR